MPARVRDLKRALTTRNISLEAPPKGSHWKLRDSTGKMYPLPCPNGEKTEISDIYLRGLCRTFGIDFDDLKADL